MDIFANTYASNQLFILLFSFSSCSKENNEDNVWGEPFKISVGLTDELRKKIAEIVPVAWLKDGSRFICLQREHTYRDFYSKYISCVHHLYAVRAASIYGARSIYIRCTHDI